MKIITMQRLTLDGKPATYNTATENGEDYRDWWCVIETEEEKIVYEDYLENYGNYMGDQRRVLWNQMVIHAGQDMGVSWGDDDIYGYISPNEKVPEVKENFKDGEGDIWVRVQ